MIITDEDNNENANELMTRESFDCQNGHYKLTGQCENTPFHLLSSYCRAELNFQYTKPSCIVYRVSCIVYRVF